MKHNTEKSLVNELFRNEEEGLIHTSYAEEKAILECVKRGDVEALEATYLSLPKTVYGKMTSSNSLVKEMFYAGIASATLVTRYAIEGGLDEETAFSLSDIYIRKMEVSTDPSEIDSIMEDMGIDFTKRVSLAKKAAHPYSPQVQKVMDYIYHGRNKDLSLDNLSKIAKLSPKYLSTLFHKETGETISDFVSKVIIDEAKNLLTYSDYSLSEISSYLNFSTQSYFIKVFKKYAGITPREYRRMYKQSNW